MRRQQLAINPLTKALRIALIFGIVSIIYILLSDLLLAERSLTVSALLTGELIKGLAYVILTSLLLFTLLYHAFSEHARQQNVILKNQKAIAESEAQYRTLVSSMSDILLVLDEDDRFVDVYHQPDALLALDPEEFLGQKIQEIMPPDVVSEYERLAARVRQTGETQRHEYTMDISGNSRWFLSTLDRHSDNQHVLANIRDITSQKRTAIELQRMFEISPDLLCTVDSATGYFIKLNPAWSATLGFSLDELYDRPVMEFIHPEDREATVKEIEKQLSGQSTRFFENRYRTKNGNFRWLSWRAAPANDGVLFATARDITAQKRQRIKERETLTRRRREAEAISAIATSPELASGDFEAICTQATELATHALTSARAGVWLFEEKASVLVNQNTYDAKDQVHFHGQSLDAERFPQLFTALQNTNHIAVEEAWADERTSQLQAAYLKPNNILSMLLTVIRSGEKVLGVFSLEHTQEIHQWAADEISFATQLSDQLALTLSNREKHETQAALQHSERQYEALFHSIQDAIVVGNLEGHIIDCNAYFTQMFGHTKEDILGQPDEILYGDPDEYRKMRALLETRMDDPAKPTIVEFRTNTGELFLGEVVSFFLRNSERKRQGFVGIIRDVTFREQQIEQQRRYVQAINQAGEAIVITDPDGRIEYVNPAFTEITGYTREEAIGRYPSILKSGKHSQEFYQDLWEIIQSGESWSGQLVNRRKDGALYTEDAVISPVKDSRGHIINYVAVKRDITEQLQLEAQLRQSQKMEAVGQLAGSVAHDFNNLLTIINGYTSILSSHALPDETHELLSSIGHAGQRASDLTKQLLAFSRKQTLEPQIIQPDELLHNIIPMLDRLLAENITIQIATNANDISILADPGQLEQVILNLAINARDAMNHGGKLHITSNQIPYSQLPPKIQEEYEADTVEYYSLHISDSGIGIEPSLREKIFEPFFTTKPEGQGTGLGLSTVYGIVKQSGGAIDVESQVGKGSTFIIYFPVSTHPATAQVKEPSSKEVDLQGRSILVVDDDPGILKFVRYVLETNDLYVYSCETAREALDIIHAQAPEIEILLCDVILEDGNGSDLAEKCKNIQPGLHAILMSGYTDNHTLKYLLDGHSIGLRKPFEQEELIASIRNALIN